jgi:hypothetical protein
MKARSIMAITHRGRSIRLLRNTTASHLTTTITITIHIFRHRITIVIKAATAAREITVTPKVTAALNLMGTATIVAVAEGIQVLKDDKSRVDSL